MDEFEIFRARAYGSKFDPPPPASSSPAHSPHSPHAHHHSPITLDDGDPPFEQLDNDDVDVDDSVRRRHDVTPTDRRHGDFVKNPAGHGDVISGSHRRSSSKRKSGRSGGGSSGGSSGGSGGGSVAGVREGGGRRESPRRGGGEHESLRRGGGEQRELSGEGDGWRDGAERREDGGYASPRHGGGGGGGGTGAAEVIGHQQSRVTRLGPSRVTVAIEPPSPTDGPPRDGALTNHSSSSRSRGWRERAYTADVADDYCNSNEYEDGEREGHEEEPDGRQLQRSRTAPPNKSSSSRKTCRSVSPSSRRPSSDDNAMAEERSAATAQPNHVSGSSSVAVVISNAQDINNDSEYNLDAGQPANVRRKSNSGVPSSSLSSSPSSSSSSSTECATSARKARGEAASSSSSFTAALPHTASTTAHGRKDSAKKGRKCDDARPDHLRIPKGVNLSRRRSSTGVPEAFYLGYGLAPSPNTVRRNSYTGGVATTDGAASGGRNALAISPGTFNSGRRNSAITYLTEAVAAGLGGGCAVAVAGGGRRRSAVGGASVSSLSANRRPSADEARTSPSAGLGGGEGVISSPEEGGTEGCGSCPVYTVLVLGSPGVGKTTLTQQLLTSEYLANTDNYEETISGERRVTIRLDNEDSVVRLVDDQTYGEQGASFEMDDFDAYLIVYSVTDRNSFTFAQLCLQDIHRTGHPSLTTTSLPGRPGGEGGGGSTKGGVSGEGMSPGTRGNCLRQSPSSRKRRRAVAVLVANKQDLVRNRTVSTSDGKRLASKRHCKILEVSALLDHKVDEVLVAIIRETRRVQRVASFFRPIGRDSEDSGDSSGSGAGGGGGAVEQCRGCLRQATVELFRKLFK